MDGHQFSNTKWLHDNAGWKGLLIEADPGGIRRLVLIVVHLIKHGGYLP